MADLDAVINNSIADLVAADAAESGAGDVVETPEAGEGETPVETETPSEGEQPEAVESDTPPVIVTEKPKKWIRRDQAEKERKTLEETHAKALADLQNKLKGYAWADEQKTKDKLRAIEVAERQPDLMVAALLSDPRYAPIMLTALKAHPEHGKAFAPAPVVEQPPSDMPKPELMPDGSMGYSEQGLQKLLAWNRAEAKKEALADAKKEFDERLKKYDPIVEEREARQRLDQSFERTGKILAYARENWPKFKENEKEMNAWLKDKWQDPANKHLNVHDAYMAVVVHGKLQADRDKMRKELIEEMRTKRAAGDQVKRTRPVSAPVNGKRSIEQIIAGHAAELEAAEA